MNRLPSDKELKAMSSQNYHRSPCAFQEQHEILPNADRAELPGYRADLNRLAQSMNPRHQVHCERRSERNRRENPCLCCDKKGSSWTMTNAIHHQSTVSTFRSVTLRDMNHSAAGHRVRGTGFEFRFSGPSVRPAHCCRRERISEDFTQI